MRERSEQYKKMAERYERATKRPLDRKTNADRIRAMSDEELAEFIEEQRVCNVCHRKMNSCFPESVLNWLQQPAEEE